MPWLEPILAFAVGLAASWTVVYLRARGRLAGARREVDALHDRARAQAERIRVQAEREAERERARLEDAESEALARARQELTDAAADVAEREALLDSRGRVVDDIERQVADAGRSVDDVLGKARALALEAEATRSARRAALEQRSGQSANEVREQRVREHVSKVELSLLMRLREMEEGIQETVASDSRAVMLMAMERYDAAGHLERVQNTVPIEHATTFAALADGAGRCHRAFVDEIGCELVCDEALRTASVRGDDPLARELARRVLRQLAALKDCDPDKIRAAARTLKMEVDREVQAAGRRAARVLEVGRLHPDILHLVGRLKYRLSYSQNQWRHSIEVGYLAGMMAEELGLDVAQARRGGLLHDIGKAMTHDHEGSHAVLGAEVARRCGEEEIVANAIGAHHNDEPPKSAIAHIVTAADAMSGARPGARRESVTQYLNRIQNLQHIASRSPAVRRVDIMQAGREVRVVVAGEERGAIDASERHDGPIVADADIQPLAQEIARSIQSELTFAGQIKVTVIRESRSVAIAH